MSVFTWSKTAASNATADSSINARENQAPSTVNDAIRGVMAAIAKWRDDLSGNLVTGGTASAYTVTTNQVYTALTDGISVKLRMSETNSAGATLNVDGLGAKSIATIYGTAIRAGALLSGSVHEFVYDSTDEKWIAVAAPDNGVKTGEIKAYVGTTAPDGYVRANGRTLGNASSGGTERASADTSELFSLLWNSYSNAICPVSGGRGASAAADYAANKTITLPDLRGRALFGLDDMGSSAAGRLAAATIDQTTNGASGGADTVTLVTGNLPSHSHTFSDTVTTGGGGSHQHSISIRTATGVVSSGGGVEALVHPSNGFSSGSTSETTDTEPSHTHSVTVSGTTSSVGSGTAVDKLPPCFLTTFIIKL